MAAHIVVHFKHLAQGLILWLIRENSSKHP